MKNLHLNHGIESNDLSPLREQTQLCNSNSNYREQLNQYTQVPAIPIYQGRIIMSSF